MKRSEMVSAVEERETVWDVIVIGGGATGLGAAVEAASRGHRTLLVEADDFAKGTSSRSTKLIHGGVRYLRQGKVSMVTQSLRERQRLLMNAPHLVHPLQFVLPTYRPGSRLFYYAGLRLYDLLAGQIFTDRARCLSKEEASTHLPTLKVDNLLGAVLYTDGQFDDSRLAIALAQTAVKLQAIVVNYMPVVQLLRTAGRVSGVVVRDEESGQEHSIRGRCVVNATGVFAETILNLDADPREFQVDRNRPVVTPSQGSHLVLDSSFLPGSTALMIPQTDDGRVLFAIPWHGKVLLGTTDLPVREVSREPRPMEGEVQYLLQHAGRYLNRSPKESDIRSRFAGLRPLVGRRMQSSSTSQLSREHEIYISQSGLITVIGGKWTTYRSMGQELIDRAERVGGLARRRSVTATLRLHGCSADSTIPSSKNDPSRVYGDDTVRIAAMIEADPALGNLIHAELPYRAADVVWAARFEMARTIEDVLARRTRSLFLDAAAAGEAAPCVAELLARELRLGESWKNEQVMLFKALAANYNNTSPPLK